MSGGGLFIRQRDGEMLSEREEIEAQVVTRSPRRALLRRGLRRRVILHGRGRRACTIAERQRTQAR